MYGVVLAAALSISAGTTSWNCHGCFGCYGCHGCSGCYGCYGGNAFSSCYGCSGCFGCYGGCSGCWGCYGCSGYAFTSCYGCSGCYGCYGSCYGCSGCYGSCYGTYYGCTGCYGGTTVVQPMPPAGGSSNGSAQKEIADLRQQVDSLKALLQKKLDFEEPSTTPAPPSTAAQFTINLPAEAKLFIDDVAVPSETRSFHTAKLQPGQKYYYTVRAEVMRGGAPVTDTQRVVFEAGQSVSVTFPRLAVAAALQN